MMLSLKNKTAVITGGGSGIGKAIATLFAAQGAGVHIVELNAEAAAATAEEIRAGGGAVTVHACNVSLQQEVKQVMDTIAGNAGRIDILVCSAGVSHVGDLEHTTE